MSKKTGLKLAFLGVVLVIAALAAVTLVGIWTALVVVAACVALALVVSVSITWLFDVIDRW